MKKIKMYKRKLLRKISGKSGSKKIFCVGLPKTATTSLSAALGCLGYRTQGFSPHLLNKCGVWEEELIKNSLEKADAFRDMPWCFLYRTLYQLHPDARFILTVREEHAWIESFVRHFGSRAMPLLRKGFGKEYPKGNEDHFIAKYRRHNNNVMQFFSEGVTSWC